MTAPMKSRSALFIATTWAIAGRYHNNHHQSGTAPMAPATHAPLSFCSAWTVQPGFRNPRRWHKSTNNNTPNRHRKHTSSLFSTTPTTGAASASVTSETEPKTAYRDLFPASDAITNGTLQVDEIHTLYYEIHGNGPLKALFLHGGPGSGCFPNHARFFDPTKYTVVLVDQRGAGRSTPKGCVENNTLDHLVEDCERLRRHLLPLPNSNNISNNVSSESWDVVLGGSWGATLGLAYAQKHPLALRSLVLRGICALRPSEIDWLFRAKGGSSLQLPEAWQNFSQAVVGDGGDECGREALYGYYDCFFNTGTNGTCDNSIRLAAARSWMGWEMAATSSAAGQTNDNNSANQSIPSERTVLVSSPECNSGMWRFENHIGGPISDAKGQSPEIVALQLRKDIGANNQSFELPLVSGPRPVRPLKESMPLLDSIREVAKTNSNKTGGFRLPTDYIPAQAMLTCYYSVNDLFVMGNKNLLETPFSDTMNVQGTSPIKIIGIQGGIDPICPPDTALDLLRSLQTTTNNMELRIPLESGHSMYDPAIKHELLKATDRLADEFLTE